MKRGLLILTVTAAEAVQARQPVTHAGAIAKEVAALGVAEHDAAAGQPLAVMVIGVTEMVAGEALSPGDLVGAGSTGLAVEADENVPAIGEVVIAFAATNGVVHVLLR